MSSPPAPPPPDAPAAAAASSSYSPPISDAQMRLMDSINYLAGAIQARTGATLGSKQKSALREASKQLKALEERMAEMNRNTTRPLSQVSGVHGIGIGLAPRRSQSKRRESVACILT